MSAHKTKQLKINLLPKDDFSESIVGKYLEWALTTGRYIVIITEVVVILTFFQRFTLDRKLSALNEEIYDKQIQVSAYELLEKDVRSLQGKAAFIDSLEDTVDLVTVLNFLNSTAPNDVLFESLNVSDQKFILVGVAYSDSSLETFIKSIREFPGVTDVILDNFVQEENSSSLEFTIGIDFRVPESEESNI